MPLSEEQIRKLAHLARLDLSADEVRIISPQFQSILDFVEQLRELDTEHVEPMTTALDVINCWQADVPSGGLDRSAALSNAPMEDGEYFLVPPVLGNAPLGNDSAGR